MHNRKRPGRARRAIALAATLVLVTGLVPVGAFAAADEQSAQDEPIVSDIAADPAEDASQGGELDNSVEVEDEGEEAPGEDEDAPDDDEEAPDDDPEVTEQQDGDSEATLEAQEADEGEKAELLAMSESEHSVLAAAEAESARCVITGANLPASYVLIMPGDTIAIQPEKKSDDTIAYFQFDGVNADTTQCSGNPNVSNITPVTKWEGGTGYTILYRNDTGYPFVLSYLDWRNDGTTASGGNTVYTGKTVHFLDNSYGITYADPTDYYGPGSQYSKVNASWSDLAWPNGAPASTSFAVGYDMQTISLPTPVLKGARFDYWKGERITKNGSASDLHPLGLDLRVGSSYATSSSWSSSYGSSSGVTGEHTASGTVYTIVMPTFMNSQHPGAVPHGLEAAYAIRYTPIFVGNEYTVGFDGNGGTVDGASYTVREAVDSSYDFALDISTVAAVRPGYIFRGWCTDKNNPDGTLITNTTPSGSNAPSWFGNGYHKDLYAVWDDGPATYSVTVENNGHGSASANPTSGTAGTQVTLTATPASGYKFKEWQVVAGEATVSNNVLTIGNANVTVKAIFEAVHTHSLDKVEQMAATCTDAGTEAYWKCSTCNTLFSDAAGTTEISTPVIIPALGHSWGAWTQTAAPTCTATGSETRTCTRDASHTETREVAALGHDWGQGAVTTEPTCTEEGVQEFTCSHDATHTKTEPVPALGHDWGAWEVVKEATETEDGEETRACSRCDETETRLIPHLVVEYRNTEGDEASWAKDSGEALTFVFKRSVNDDATFSHFAGIQVDGADVDPSNYTAVAGSVVVTLDASYLETLEPGGHTITALFDDGNDASAGFTVKAAEEPVAEEPAADDTAPGKPVGTAPAGETRRSTGLPSTGDPMRALPGLLAATALCGAAALVAGGRLRRLDRHGKHVRR